MEGRGSRACGDVCKEISDCPLKTNAGFFSAPWEVSVEIHQLGRKTACQASCCLFPFFRDHSGFLQIGVSWGDRFCFCCFSLLFAYKLTVFQPFPWETHPGFTLQVMRGLCREGRQWPLAGWALDSRKLMVGKYWVPWIVMCGFLGKMPCWWNVYYLIKYVLANTQH